MRVMVAMACLLAMVAFPAHAQSDHSHSAHTHGVAQLMLLQDAGTLQMEFVSPAINIVGFEHAPHDAAERSAIADALQKLQDAESILVLASATCEVAHVQASVSGEMAAHTHDGHSDGHGHTGHSGFAVTMIIHCDAERFPTEFLVNAFDRFPWLETIEIQWALANTQGASRLSAGTTYLRIDQ